MIIRHKVKAGETLEKIAARYKVKDLKALWNWEENRALKRKRTKPGNLTAGDLLALPDVRVKLYKFKYRGKDYIFDEHGWRKFQDDFVVTMQVRVIRELRVSLDNLNIRHRDLKNIGRDYPIASWFSEVWSWDSLSDKEKTAAEAAFAKLEASVTKGSFGQIAADAKALEKAMSAYTEELRSCSESMIKGSGRAMVATAFTRDASFAIATAIAVTVTLPAGAGYLMTAGVASAMSATTSGIKSVSGEIGHVAAGAKSFDLEKITWKALWASVDGAKWGAVGGVIGKFMCGALAEKVASKYFNGPVMRKVCSKLGGHPVWNYVDDAMDHAWASDVMAKMMIRSGVANFIVAVRWAVEQEWSEVINAGTKAVRRSGGQGTAMDLVDLMLPALPMSRILEAAIYKLMEQNQKAIAAELRAQAAN